MLRNLHKLSNLSLMKEIVLIGIWTANMVLDPRQYYRQSIPLNS